MSRSGPPQNDRRRPWWPLAALALLATLLLATGWHLRPRHPPAPAATAKNALPQFVANRECLDCHAAEARRWQTSHHAHALAPAAAAGVAGRFDGGEFRATGLRARFFLRDGHYGVRTEGPDGRVADFDVAFAIGVAPLQQYLLRLPGGRLQALPIAWDTTAGRWFNLRPDDAPPAGDVLHWSGRYQTANTMCIGCHTTGYEKRYDAASDRFDSRWVDDGVACQACHGPGAEHVRRAHAAAREPATAPVGSGLLAPLSGASASSEADVCAACHARRSELTARATPGHALLDDFLPSLLTEGLYYPDGQQQDEVYVDGSFRQSRMFAAGVRCSDCHDPHSARPRLEGNGLCTQCHRPGGNPRFPAAAGRYDTPEHHHHRPGTPGAACTACHMPSRTYLQVQARPDHAIRVPRPDLATRLGTPDACTGCHRDHPARWAAGQVVAWFGPLRKHDPPYGAALAAGRAGAAGAAAALAALAVDVTRPAIVRASALATLGSDQPRGLGERIAATRDHAAEVRAAAADSLAAASPGTRVAALAPLLVDPVRAVRMAALRSLSAVPHGALSAAQRVAFDAAYAEFVAAQSVSLDLPGPRLALGVVYANVGRVDLAEQQYAAALRIDPDFTPARANLALLYNATGRNADAERVLDEGLARHPEVGELQYSRGLLLGEEGRLPAAADALGRAARLLPRRARVRYNLGLVELALGREPAGLAALQSAWQLDPDDPAAPAALAIHALASGRDRTALRWARRWQGLVPADPRLAEVLRTLEARGAN